MAAWAACSGVSFSRACAVADISRRSLYICSAKEALSSCGEAGTSGAFVAGGAGRVGLGAALAGLEAGFFAMGVTPGSKAGMAQKNSPWPGGYIGHDHR